MSYVEGSALRNVFSKRSRLAVIALLATAMLGSGMILGLTEGTANAAPQAAIVEGTHCYGLDEGSGDPSSDPQWLHEISLGAGGVPATKLQGNAGDTQLVAAGNIENIALRNDASELYAYDPGTGMFLIDAGGNSVGAPTDFALSGQGDIDAMFFQDDQNGDPADDILWILQDNAGNDADVLLGFNPDGSSAGTVTIDLPETLPDGSPLGAGQENTIEGATWLAADDTFYISYTVTNSPDVVSSLASLGNGAIPAASAVRLGDLPVDVEGLGTDGDAQLFITTGEDGADANTLFQLNETGVVTSALLDLSAGAPPDPNPDPDIDQGGDADFESIDCAYPSISLVKTATAVRNADGTTELTVTFEITNDGELYLDGVTLGDPMTNYNVTAGPTPDVAAGDCSATVVGADPSDASAGGGTEDLNIDETCTAVWVYTVDDAPGDYDNTADVQGTPPNGIADTTTATGSTTTTIPAVELPSMTIVKTVVADAADCPADVASGIDGFDAITAAIGDTVVYCINVINNGPGAATGVTVTDDLDPSSPRTLADLASGDEDAYNYTRTVANEPETNTATVAATDLDGNPAPEDSDDAGTDNVEPPSLQIVKTVVLDAADCPADVASGADGLDTIAVPSGTAVIYCINVINNGPGGADAVMVTDAQDPSSPRDLGSLANGGTANFDYVVNSGDASSTNTAEVTGNDTAGNPTTPDSDQAGTTPAPPALQIVKTVVGESTACPVSVAEGIDGLDTIQATIGNTVKYCINVINNGPGNAFGVSVADDFDASSPRALGDLGPGATADYEYTHVVAADDEINVAVVSGNDGDGNPAATDSDNAGTTAEAQGTIGDKVFEDLNGNDLQDAGEPATPGVVVNLWSSVGGMPGAVIDSTTTDVDGMYLFNAPPGDYFVQFELPSGRTFVAQNAGDDALDSDAGVDGVSDIIVLGAGQNIDNVDAGLVPSTISNFVFEDTNENDLQDGGEPGVPGVVVNLWSSVNGAPGAVIDTTTTDADGLYLFNAAPGNYFVQFELPDGRTFVAQNAGDDALDSDAGVDGVTDEIVLGPGEDNDTVDAGLEPTGQATIGNFVWRDDNDNGIQDDGEPGIEGVTVNVWTTDAGGALISSQAVTTDANGEWTLDVDPGTYRINVIVPAGATGFTTQDAGDDALDSDIITSGAEFAFSPVYSVGAGDSNLTIDAGVIFPVAPGAIGDFVFEDVNNNGVQDAGEPGIADITVQVLDAGGAVVGTDVTDADGAYLVGNLAPGTYSVSFINTTTGQFTAQDVGDDATDSDANASGLAAAVEVMSNMTNDTVDAGIVFDPTLGSISNFVFEDTNEDGQQDAGEPGVANVTVNLWSSVNGAPGAVIDTTTTDVNGLYSFNGLAEGNYFVEFEAPAGRDFTAADVGADATDSDAGANGITSEIALGEGENNPTVDAGLLPIPLGSISNFVFEDTNEDGQQAAGEPGVEGVVVNLWSSVNGAPGAVIDTMTTDANGLYLFDGLDAGNYFVQFEAPAGRDFTSVNIGADATDSDAGTNGVTDEIVLGVNEDNVTIDAGLLPLAPTPVIGLAKDLVGSATYVGGGRFQVTYDFTIENLGNVTLTDVTIADDFEAVFDPATVVSGPTPAATGCSAAVAGAGTTLAVGESCTARWSVVLAGLESGRVYNNTATVTGTAPDDSTVTDISDDGVVTDTDDDGEPNEPGENDPTPIQITIGRCQVANPPADCTVTPSGCLDNEGNAAPAITCLKVPDPGPFNNAPPSPESIPAPVAAEPLAFTGSSANILATLALALMGLGGALMIGARRRNDED